MCVFVCALLESRACEVTKIQEKNKKAECTLEFVNSSSIDVPVGLTGLVVKVRAGIGDVICRCLR